MAKARVEVDRDIERQRETVRDRVHKERVEVDEDVEYRESPAASTTEKGADESVEDWLWPLPRPLRHVIVRMTTVVRRLLLRA